jgi:hypothetical protein
MYSAADDVHACDSLRRFDHHHLITISRRIDKHKFRVSQTHRRGVVVGKKHLHQGVFSRVRSAARPRNSLDFRNVLCLDATLDVDVFGSEEPRWLIAFVPMLFYYLHRRRRVEFESALPRCCVQSNVDGVGSRCGLSPSFLVLSLSLHGRRWVAQRCG